MSIIIEYPKTIEIPHARSSRGDVSIKYASFTKYNIEDEESQVNWYFTYKRDMKKLIVFKEMKSVDEILKYEIPTARTIGGITGFIKELNKIGIKSILKKEEE